MFNKKLTCLFPVRVVSVISKYELNINLHVLLAQPQKILTLRAITFQNGCNITGIVKLLAGDLQCIKDRDGKQHTIPVHKLVSQVFSIPIIDNPTKPTAEEKNNNSVVLFFEKNDRVPTADEYRRPINKVPNGYVVDHINEDKFDNSVFNLRIITQRNNVICSVGKDCIIYDPIRKERQVYNSCTLANDAIGQIVRFHRTNVTQISDVIWNRRHRDHVYFICDIKNDEHLEQSLKELIDVHENQMRNDVTVFYADNNDTIFIKYYTSFNKAYQYYNNSRFRYLGNGLYYTITNIDGNSTKVFLMFGIKIVFYINTEMWLYNYYYQK